VDFKTVNKYLLSFTGATKEFPYGKETAVYLIPDENNPEDTQMFALIAIDSDPVQLSLKCDPRLSRILREKYVTVMQGYKLDKKYWNTIILSGEIDWEEVKGFIQHSYDLVRGADNARPTFTS
jgi:predicted DNA-binding protein (MmcQ/YjbR family)